MIAIKGFKVRGRKDLFLKAGSILKSATDAGFVENKKDAADAASLIGILKNHTALVTAPERRHLVQTLTWRGVPLTRAFTRLTLGFHILLDLLCEWETLIPKVMPLPHISHFAIVAAPPLTGNHRTTPNIIPCEYKKCKGFY